MRPYYPIEIRITNFFSICRFYGIGGYTHDQRRPIMPVNHPRRHLIRRETQFSVSVSNVAVLTYGLEELRGDVEFRCFNRVGRNSQRLHSVRHLSFYLFRMRKFRESLSNLKVSNVVACPFGMHFGLRLALRELIHIILV